MFSRTSNKKYAVVFCGSSWSGSPAIAATRLPDDPSPRSTRSPAEQAVSATMSDATMPTAANTAGLVIAITPEPFAFGSLPAGDLKPLGAITRDFAERTLRYSAA
jgi:hypothetical protein